MAKKQNIVAVDTPAQEVPAEDQTLPEGEVVQDPAPVAEDPTPVETFVAAYVKPPEYQAKALEEQGAFDYHIQGVEAVLKSPYTEGSAEHFHYSKGWNDAFNEDNKG